jgi:hypothetical protein
MRDIALVSASLCHRRIVWWDASAERDEVSPIRAAQSSRGHMVLIGVPASRCISWKSTNGTRATGSTLLGWRDVYSGACGYCSGGQALNHPYFERFEAGFCCRANDELPGCVGVDDVGFEAAVDDLALDDIAWLGLLA